MLFLKLILGHMTFWALRPDDYIYFMCGHLTITFASCWISLISVELTGPGTKTNILNKLKKILLTPDKPPLGGLHVTMWARWASFGMQLGSGVFVKLWVATKIGWWGNPLWEASFNITFPLAMFFVACTNYPSVTLTGRRSNKHLAFFVREPIFTGRNPFFGNFRPRSGSDFEDM